MKAPHACLAVEMADAAWESRADVPALDPTEAHVWRFPLTASPSCIARAALRIDTEESERVALLANDMLRSRQILATALLRTVLGRYLQLAPREVPLVRAGNGKPFLGSRSGSPVLHFNLSHSGDLALLAIASHADVGVDVEQHRPLSDLGSLIRTVLTPSEQALVLNRAPEEQLRLFRVAWVLKEACLKATGEGVVGLQDVEAILEEQNGAPLYGIRRLDASVDPAAKWSVWRLHPDYGFSAALVVAGPCSGLRTLALQAGQWLT